MNNFRHSRFFTFFALLLCLIFSVSACRTQKDTESASAYSSSLPQSAISDSSVSSEEEPKDNGIRLNITSPEKTSVNVTEPDFTFSGTSDPVWPLTVNGQIIERGETGAFTYETVLDVGKNTFEFEHKGEKKVYTVTYRYIVINSFSPSGAQSYPSGSKVIVTVSARKGSSVKASFNGRTVALTQEKNPPDNSEFASYNGLLTLPSDNARDISLGKITYTATHNGKSQTFTSGNITCK